MPRVTIKAETDKQGKTGFYVVSGGVSKDPVRCHGKERAEEIAGARRRVLKKRRERQGK